MLPRSCVLLPRSCVLLPRSCVSCYPDHASCVLLLRSCVLLPRSCVLLLRSCVLAGGAANMLRSRHEKSKWFMKIKLENLGKTLVAIEKFRFLSQRNPHASYASHTPQHVCKWRVADRTCHPYTGSLSRTYRHRASYRHHRLSRRSKVRAISRRLQARFQGLGLLQTGILIQIQAMSPTPSVVEHSNSYPSKNPFLSSLI